MDRHYAHIGSANLDTRSLRLNFEMIVEIYSRTTAETLVAHFEEQAERSREMTLRELEARSLLTRMRDALCWLFTPYL
ncbi:phospholipase D-like domain-containing protein [Desulfonema ishimotonii]|uniref:phospholipase D-like domain-containing protein n=1 Tax=Desulfonema ishimotonii TaxID=45657 RepID=UPI00350E3543